MANADFREYTLFCPVCNVNFKQLIVLHKLPKSFDVDSALAGILADAVQRHDHKAYQDAQAQKIKDGADPQKLDEAQRS
jgi:hypothetical protein